MSATHKQTTEKYHHHLQEENVRAKGRDGGGGGDSLMVCSKITQYLPHVLFCPGWFGLLFTHIFVILSDSLSAWLLRKEVNAVFSLMGFRLGLLSTAQLVFGVLGSLVH